MKGLVSSVQKSISPVSGSIVGRSAGSTVALSEGVTEGAGSAVSVGLAVEEGAATSSLSPPHEVVKKHRK